MKRSKTIIFGIVLMAFFQSGLVFSAGSRKLLEEAIKTGDPLGNVERKTGSYMGSFSDDGSKEALHLLLSRIQNQNRPNSFVGILMTEPDGKQRSNAFVYIVDPSEAGSGNYTMIPLVQEDALLMKEEIAPPLLLSIQAGEIVIAPSNGEATKTGFSRRMSFTCDSNILLDDSKQTMEPGLYLAGSSKRFISVYNDGLSLDAEVTLKRSYSGKYFLRKGAPAVFAVRSQNFTPYGVEEERNVSAVIAQVQIVNSSQTEIEDYGALFLSLERNIGTAETLKLLRQED